MTNREKFKDKLDHILATVIGVVDGEPVLCENVECSECCFEHSETCERDAREWLDAEYQGPPVDWIKVAVDTPVLVLEEPGGRWSRGHYAGITADNRPMVWCNRQTSWTAKGKRWCPEKVKLENEWK